MQKKIIVLDYSSNWKNHFEDLKSHLLPKLKNLIRSIEHVGSTSVEGLAAKPVIDLDIVIQDDDLIEKDVINILKTFGYLHIGNLGITGREAFKKESEFVPYSSPEKIWPAHNLYLCKEGSIGLRNHTALRDYLRNNPEERDAYSILKKELAQKFPEDIDAYIDGKTAFITNILAKCGLSAKETDLISGENKLKD